MCESCVRDGGISQDVYLAIDSFLAIYPDAEHGNGHIVLADCNVRDTDIEWCLTQELRDHERAFLSLLRYIPENVRCPKHSG